MLTNTINLQGKAAGVIISRLEMKGQAEADVRGRDDN